MFPVDMQIDQCSYGCALEVKKLVDEVLLGDMSMRN